MEALARYTHPHGLVIDEVGYLGNGAANVLFHVVNDRHLRKRSMVFTTNERLTDLGRVLRDADLAAAIVDRILERGRLLQLDGPSMRTRHPRQYLHHPEVCAPPPFSTPPVAARELALTATLEDV